MTHNQAMFGRRYARLTARPLVGILVAGLAMVPTHALAQEGAEPPEPKPQLASDQGLGDIIVTAQRREESVQKVPIAVSVVTAEQFDNRNGVSLVDVSAMTPSVVFSQGFIAKNSSLRIRGIGTDNSSISVEPSVSTVVDGVVLQRAGQAFTDLGDVDRIEVLRGPQGTLFGKNSAAGVVNVVTKDPSLVSSEGSVALVATDDEEYRVNAVVSVPLSDIAGIRAVGFYRYFDGNVRNVRTGNNLNGVDAFGGRIKLLVRPTDAFSVKISADYIKADSTCCAAPPRDFGPVGAKPTLPPFAFTPGPNNDSVDNDVESYANSISYGGSIQFEYETAGPTLTWISAVRHYGIKTEFDFDNTGGKFYPTAFNDEPNDTYTHEFRVTSPGTARLRYVAGVLYMDSKVSNDVLIQGRNNASVVAVNPVTGDVTSTLPLGCNCGLSSLKGTNLGIYGQLDFQATERLTLTAGGRYIRERQHFRFDRPTPGIPPTPALPFREKKYGDDATIYRVAAAYELTDQIMTYVSHSTGYTGEAANSGITLSASEFNDRVPIRPMTSKLTEIGIKSRLFDKVQLNVAAFRTRFKDYQATTIRQDNGLNQLANVGSVAIDGVEVELFARPVRGLSINGGITILDARYLKATNACAPVSLVPSGSPDCSLIPVSGVPTRILILDGKQFSNAPDVRYTLNTRYEFPLGGGMGGYVQGDYRWQSKVRLDTNRNPLLIQKSYGVADFTVGMTFADDKYNLEAFVKNAFSQQYVNQIRTFNNNVISTNANSGFFTANELPRDFHRYFGAAFRAKF
jgi:iron complex outermembrane recepter protein